MGKFTFLHKDHCLKICYQLDYFEVYSSNQIEDKYCIYLEHDKNNKYIKQLNHFITLEHYIKKGITYEQLLNVLYQICIILKQFEQNYIKLDNCILHYNQFLIDENTQKVKFLYVNTVGSLQYIHFKNLINFIVDTTCFLTIDNVEKMELLACVEDLVQLEKIIDEEKYCTQLLLPLDNRIQFILSNNNEQYSFDLKENDVITVGRLKQSDIYFSNDTISKEHAKFICYQNQLCLVDCGTKNGTFINDYLLQHTMYYKVNHNDIIKFSQLSFRCEILKGEKYES